MAKRKLHQISADWVPPGTLIGEGGAGGTLERQALEAQDYHAWLQNRAEQRSWNSVALAKTASGTRQWPDLESGKHLCNLLRTKGAKPKQDITMLASVASVAAAGSPPA